jgi:hydroxymethylbilane synthase
VLTIGSRGSELALWQARWVQQKLEELGQACRIEIVRTTGDKMLDAPLARLGGKGLFTKEIEEALLEGRVDLAVHSLKDLPTLLGEGLCLAAVPVREDPRDAVVGRRLADLPRGARVGTSSLRRAAQLRALRPDLGVEPVRGNLDTRLRKLAEGQFDALLLAAAGLHRLGWQDRVAEYLPVEVMCPAVGQGALAIETRDDGGEARQFCSRLEDAATRACVTAERALLSALGGGCQVPIAGYAWMEGGRLRLVGVVASPDGSGLVRRETWGALTEAGQLGEQLARELLGAGARAILVAVHKLFGKRIVVTRAREQASELSGKLRALGAEVIELPTIEIRPAQDCGPLDAALRRLDAYDWVIFTSANGVRFFSERLEVRGAEAGAPRARICAIGPGTRRAVEERGWKVDLVPARYVAESLVEAFAGEDLTGKRILLPRAAVARDVVPAELARRGAQVDVVEAYRTAIPEQAPALARQIFSGVRKPDWVTFTSSSTAVNFARVAGAAALEGVRVASIGPVTTGAARKHGLEVTVEAEAFTIDGLIEAILRSEGVA